MRCYVSRVMRWPEPADRALVEILRALPNPTAPRTGGATNDAKALVQRAELHGVTGVVHDAFEQSGDAPPELAAKLDALRIARDLDHAAHLEMLERIDEHLVKAGLRAVALKGALLAERYYPRPSARATTDIDLLVREADLERAVAALGQAGYAGRDDPEEERFRREHHHLHFSHPHALPLELHFHAYKGFGGVLRSEPLLEASVASTKPALRAIRVLSQADELAFLAVHGAAHRFVRLGWLLDLKLLALRMDETDLEDAARAARASGFARAVALAASLLVDVLGVSASRLRPLGALGLREPLVRALVGEPRDRWIRSATRLVYATALCDSAGAAFRYASAAARGHGKRILARGAVVR